MGYDRGDSFPLDFEPNKLPFNSKSKGKLPPRSYPIQCERKWKASFLSAENTSVSVWEEFVPNGGFGSPRPNWPFYYEKNKKKIVQPSERRRFSASYGQ